MAVWLPLVIDDQRLVDSPDLPVPVSFLGSLEGFHGSGADGDDAVPEGIINLPRDFNHPPLQVDFIPSEPQNFFNCQSGEPLKGNRCFPSRIMRLRLEPVKKIQTIDEVSL